MTQEHPITPPPELFAEWLAEAKRLHPKESLGFISGQIAQLAYQAGADQELEACKKVILDQGWFASPEFRLDQLHNARRPKPSSLKAQALKALEAADGADHPVVATVLTADQHALIRTALESLPD